MSRNSLEENYVPISISKSFSELIHHFILKRSFELDVSVVLIFIQE